MTNSFNARDTLEVNGHSYQFFRLDAIEGSERLPFATKILLENLLRHEDGVTVTKSDIEALAAWDPKAEPSQEIQYRPARVLMQDFTGVPAVVDLAAMRDALAELGGDPDRINPLQPAELVIDHSVQVDRFGVPNAWELNAKIEFERNRERYQFLKWGQQAFDNFKVVPPDTGASRRPGAACPSAPPPKRRTRCGPMPSSTRSRSWTPSASRWRLWKNSNRRTAAKQL